MISILRLHMLRHYKRAAGQWFRDWKRSNARVAPEFFGCLKEPIANTQIDQLTIALIRRESTSRSNGLVIISIPDNKKPSAMATLSA